MPAIRGGFPSARSESRWSTLCRSLRPVVCKRNSKKSSNCWYAIYYLNIKVCICILHSIKKYLKSNSFLTTCLLLFNVVVVASKYLYHAVHVQRLLSTPYFRCYTSQDVIGVELGGALKNPLAIGAGMIEGSGL